jgi:hypothetical protein
MDIDAFWQLIADSLEHAPGRAAREHYLEGRLAALAPDGIVAFQAFLDQACDRAFTWELVGAATRIFGGWCSDDSFEHFRLWLIGRGRVTFERAITMPGSLATVPAIQAWPAVADASGTTTRNGRSGRPWTTSRPAHTAWSPAPAMSAAKTSTTPSDPSWAARASGVTQTGSAGMPQTSQPRR